MNLSHCRKRGPARSRVLLTALIALAAACGDSPTAPRPDFDPAEWPYLVNDVGVRLFGTTRVLVILARFQGGAPEPLTSANIQAQLFGGAGGPMTQAFGLASGGAFTLRGQVTTWVTTSVSLEAAQMPGAPSAYSGYVIDALGLVEPEVDFGLYDNDGADGFPNSGDDDGVVDGGVAIYNSETDRYCAGGTGLGPHPFARSGWRINGERYKTQDPSTNGGVIEVGAYTLLSATACGGPTVSSHVLSHELGHLFLSLPDLYHPVGGAGEAWQTRRWVIGCWELMAAGGWGCGTGAPTLDYRFNTLGAWTRIDVGWGNPIVVDPAVDAYYDLHPMGRGGTILRVPIGSDEYLLLEYRESAPGDTRLPANGVLIYHIAESRPLRPSTGPYRISLVEADDDSSLFRTELQGGNRGTASDAFGISRTSFVSGQHSRARAVDGSPLPFAITEISVNAVAHKARVRILPATLADRSR